MKARGDFDATEIFQRTSKIFGCCPSKTRDLHAASLRISCAAFLRLQFEIGDCETIVRRTEPLWCGHDKPRNFN